MKSRIVTEHCHSRHWICSYDYDFYHEWTIPSGYKIRNCGLCYYGLVAQEHYFNPLTTAFIIYFENKRIASTLVKCYVLSSWE